MARMTVGIRELKARLSHYIRQVKAGATLVLTERGNPIARMMPLPPSAETRVRQLSETGLVAWSGRKLAPQEPVARTSGERTVANILLEGRALSRGAES